MKRFLTNGIASSKNYPHHRLLNVLAVSGGLSYFFDRANKKLEATPIEIEDDKLCFYASAIRYEGKPKGIVLVRDITEKFLDDHNQEFHKGFTPYVVQIVDMPHAVPTKKNDIFSLAKFGKYSDEYIYVKQDIVQNDQFKSEETDFAKQIVERTTGAINHLIAWSL